MALRKGKVIRFQERIQVSNLKCDMFQFMSDRKTMHTRLARIENSEAPFFLPLAKYLELQLISVKRKRCILEWKRTDKSRGRK